MQDAWAYEVTYPDLRPKRPTNTPPCVALVIRGRVLGRPHSSSTILLQKKHKKRREFSAHAHAIVVAQSLQNAEIGENRHSKETFAARRNASLGPGMVVWTLGG